MVLGTMPQQDAFQRIACTNSANTARLSTILGGIIYLLGTMIPIFIMVALYKAKILVLNGDVSESFLVSYVLEHCPIYLQVIFAGVMLAAISSVLSGTSMASAVLISHNVLRNTHSKINDLLAMRIGLIFTMFSCAIYAINTKESIHELVVNSGNYTMVMAFCPLIGGLYFKRVSKIAALFSSIGGGLVWKFLDLYQFYIAPSSDLILTNPLWGGLFSFIFIVLFTLLYPNKNHNDK